MKWGSLRCSASREGAIYRLFLTAPHLLVIFAAERLVMECEYAKNVWRTLQGTDKTCPSGRENPRQSQSTRSSAGTTIQQLVVDLIRRGVGVLYKCLIQFTRGFIKLERELLKY